MAPAGLVVVPSNALRPHHRAALALWAGMSTDPPKLHSLLIQPRGDVHLALLAASNVPDTCCLHPACNNCSSPTAIPAPTPLHIAEAVLEEVLSQPNTALPCLVTVSITALGPNLCLHGHAPTGTDVPDQYAAALQALASTWCPSHPMHFSGLPPGAVTEACAVLIAKGWQCTYDTSCFQMRLSGNELSRALKAWQKGLPTAHNGGRDGMELGALQHGDALLVDEHCGWAKQ
jgi:hypothetical protein